MRRRAALLLPWVLVAGCATAPPPVPTSGVAWSGRLALTVQSEPPQSFSAGFTLQGSAQDGLLQLSTPLGQTLATVRWTPGHAELDSGGQTRDYASLDELTRQLTGSALPIGHWFDWLNGNARPADGWAVDLERLDQGRLTARRLPPAEAAELRVVIDR